MDADDIEIAGSRIKRGSRACLMLLMPKLYDWTPLTMPVHVLAGGRPGPVLCLTAAVHGDEVNGIEIIRRIIRKINPKRLSGTVIAIPIVNIYGFLNQTRYSMDRRDLNRSFPGSTTGSLASRFAYM